MMICCLYLSKHLFGLQNDILEHCVQIFISARPLLLESLRHATKPVQGAKMSLRHTS